MIKAINFIQSKYGECCPRQQASPLSREREWEAVHLRPKMDSGWRVSRWHGAQRRRVELPCPGIV